MRKMRVLAPNAGIAWLGPVTLPRPENPLDPLTIISFINYPSLLRQAGLKTDIATGERMLNRWQYRELVDVIQPDICHCAASWSFAASPRWRRCTRSSSPRTTRREGVG